MARTEFDNDLTSLKATELRLGWPGTNENEGVKNNKRCYSPEVDDVSCQEHLPRYAPAPKAQMVGWPPVRSYRKSAMNQKKQSESTITFVKVSMDGAPYLRKIDLNYYKNYSDLLEALKNMFNCNIEREGCHGSEYAPTYEDKDGDWMLVGDVPWDMFVSCCKRVRIMKGSEAKGIRAL